MKRYSYMSDAITMNGVFAGVCAACFTHPLDVGKIQKQVDCMQRRQGVGRFTRGFQAAVVRESFYCGARFPLYIWLRDETGHKVLSGAAAGVTGTILSHPFDLVKVVQVCTPLQASNSRIFINLVKSGSLYRALMPAIGKSAVFSAVQLSSFDHCRKSIQTYDPTLPSAASVPLAAWSAGILSSTVSAPLDVVKTRMMAEGASVSTLPKMIRGMVAKEGIRVFWRGAFMAWLRLGPYSFVQLSVWHALNERRCS